MAKDILRELEQFSRQYSFMKDANLLKFNVTFRFLSVQSTKCEALAFEHSYEIEKLHIHESTHGIEKIKIQTHHESLYHHFWEQRILTLEQKKQQKANIIVQ